MLLRRSKTCGLECGSSGAKLVLLSRRKGSVCIEDIVVEEEPFGLRAGGRGRSNEEILRSLLGQADILGVRTVLSANPAVQSCFLILPRMRPPDAESAILLQARKLLSWQDDDPLVAHVDSEYLADRSGSYVALGNWNDIVPFCRLIEGSGGYLDSITVRGCAYHALSLYQGWFRQCSCAMVVDIGSVSTCVYILDAHGILFSRKIAAAGDALTRALTMEITLSEGIVHLDGSQAEEAKISGHLLSYENRQLQRPPIQVLKPLVLAKEGGNPDEAGMDAAVQMEAMMRPTIERITSELLRSIKYFKDNAGRDVERIFLTGGGSEQDNLLKFLEKSVSLPLKKIAPFEGMRFANEETRKKAAKWQSRLAVAAGLALVSEPSILILSRRAKLSRRMARFADVAVALLLLFGFVPAMAGGIFSAATLRKAQSREAFYRKEISRESGRLDELRRLQVEKEKAEKRLAPLRQAALPGPVWAGVLNSLASAVPDGVVLTEAFAETKSGGKLKFVIRGDVSASAVSFDRATSSLVMAISSSVFFSDVRISSAEARRSGNSLGVFEIECRLVHGGE